MVYTYNAECGSTMIWAESTVTSQQEGSGCIVAMVKMVKSEKLRGHVLTDSCFKTQYSTATFKKGGGGTVLRGPRTQYLAPEKIFGLKISPHCLFKIWKHIHFVGSNTKWVVFCVYKVFLLISPFVSMWQNKRTPYSSLRRKDYSNKKTQTRHAVSCWVPWQS